jgi:DHA1 family bicyclomycin/chloramphenicol resistance-like MFS transporter
MRAASPWFALYLGALAALPPISIDMALPALIDTAHALHTSSSRAGLTLSLFMLGFVVGPLAYGPLSDLHGRRPVLLAGLSIFTVGGLVGSLAPSIELLWLARLAQGVGAGAGMTLALAIVRDRFEGEAMQRRIASITVAANLAPVVAPALGVALLACVHWRGIYGVMALFGAGTGLATWSGLCESAGRARARFSFGQLARDYAAVLRRRDVMAAISVNALGFGWMFSYVAGSPLILLDLLHLRPTTYAVVFAGTRLCIVAGAVLNGVLAACGMPGRRLQQIAIGLSILAGAGLTALEAGGAVSLVGVMPLAALCTFGFGLAAPSAASATLDPLPESAGAAGGLLTSVQMLAGAVTSSLVTLLFPYLGMFAMSGAMLGCALLAMAVVLCAWRHHPHPHAGEWEQQAP